MGNVTSPRIVLGAAPNPAPPLPAELGGIPIWSERVECLIGGCLSWEYRHPEYGLSAVVQLVSVLGERAIYVAWVPAQERDGANPVFAALAPALVASGALAGHWACSFASGMFRPLLDASPGAAEVLAGWPLAWRDATEEGEPPGAPYIGEVLA